MFSSYNQYNTRQAMFNTYQRPAWVGVDFNTVTEEFLPKNITSVRLAPADKCPIILGLDVTGSMGRVPRALAEGNSQEPAGLQSLIQQICTRKDITTPTVMCLAVGDVSGPWGGKSLGDDYPLQATNFQAEPTVAIAELKKLFLEGRGQANGSESYPMAWWFAANLTNPEYLMHGDDAKGLIFTVGDERCQTTIYRGQLQHYTGTGERDYTATELLAAARQSYHVFHLVIGTPFSGSTQCRAPSEEMLEHWYGIMGKNFVVEVTDWRKIPEIITAIIARYCAHKETAMVVSSFDLATQDVVSTALANITTLALRDSSDSDAIVASVLGNTVDAKRRFEVIEDEDEDDQYEGDNIDTDETAALDNGVTRMRITR